MPELTWLGKDAIRHHHLEVPYRPFVPTATFEAPDTPADAPAHRIIHGDNLEALKSLLPEFAGRVKCIYIDPPYNTGNKDWAYNDNVSDPRLLAWLGKYVGKEADDLSRHDKWLCMMYPRLHLLHKLLAEDGAIFISIDDNEVAHLRCIMDEVFGARNFMANIIWQHSIQPKGYSGTFSNHHNQTLCYCKSFFELSNLTRTEEDNKSYTSSDERGRYRTGYMVNALYRPNLIYPVSTPSGKVIAPPEKGWRYSKETMTEKMATGEIIFSEDETRLIRKIYLDSLNGRTPENIWFGKDVGTTRDANTELKALFPEGTSFDTPKPTKLIERILELAATDPDSIVLDSFAGSGTTLHAVAKLNARDGGRRQCLLVEVEAYADTLTAERARRVLAGYGAVPGLGGRFEFGELGGPLFDAATGLLDPAAPLTALRQYVWWQETGTQLPPDAATPPDHPSYLSTAPDGARIYFDYHPAHPSTLDAAWLGGLTVPAPRYVIYADSCEVNADWLAMYDVVYKKIPRDLARL